MLAENASMRLLLVDDDPAILSTFARTLRIHAKLAPETANSGTEALRRLAGEPFDAIVSDVQMPGMNGYELLLEVRRLHPEVIRVISSATVCTPEGLTLVHQYWVKPWSAHALVEGLRRTARVLLLVKDRRWRAEAADVGRLPAAPPVVVRLNRVLVDPCASALDAAHVIEGDPALAAKILQLSSSAFFGSESPTTSIAQAVVRLGTEIIRSLATASALYDTIVPPRDVLDVERHQAESLLVAQVASQLVDLPEDRPGAFAAGLLSGIGRLILAARVPEAFRDIVAESGQSHRSLADVEQSKLGVTHAELGAYLLGIWGLPDVIVEAVAHQRDGIQMAPSGLAVRDALSLAMLLVETPEALTSATDPATLEELVNVAGSSHLGEWRALVARLVSSAGPVRRFPRTPVRWATMLHEGTTTVVGTACDVSAKGIFVATETTLEPGTAVVVQVDLPEGRKLQVPGVVRWCGHSTAHGVSGAGIELDDQQPELDQYIRGLRGR
jgi:HD-like signal output (HDOD) protein